MKQTITETMFKDAFRAIRPDNFSYNGLSALFAHIEEVEEACGYEHEMELDVIALCCDFSEYESLLDFACEYYGQSAEEVEEYFNADSEELKEDLREWITNNGQLIQFDGGIIVSAF